MAAPGKEVLPKSRRIILKLLGASAAAAALAPYMPFGEFLQERLPGGQKEVKIANVADDGVSAPGSDKLFSFPRPAEEDPFSSSVLIHLPKEHQVDFGVEFVAYNRTCVHLRCLVNYQADREQIECPCHGSVYRVGDAKPTAGPALLLGLNPLPEIVLRVDSNGDIFALELNGQIGFGRTGDITSAGRKVVRDFLPRDLQGF